jgi:type ISP restriction-modification system protein/N-6 DNA methylase
LPNLTKDSFADLYAQTICYGLFSAKCNSSSHNFTRKNAAFELPKTNPFLRQMFHYVAGPDLDDRIAWVVDDLAEVLNSSDITPILSDFRKKLKHNDPVIHFYETFLAQYDSHLRKVRGVYYTPEPVVDYIVNSVNLLLKNAFHLPNGLSNNSKIRLDSKIEKNSKEIHKVLILDPAVGTGTFLQKVIDLIFKSFHSNMGMWNSYLTHHLLPRLFGFEILMAPYAIAHMKLGFKLAETGYKFNTNERLRIYLTNTLDDIDKTPTLPGFTQWVAQEASAASEIKKELPILIVLGNPPYSGISKNKSKWIIGLLKGRLPNGTKVQSYYDVEGDPLGEKKVWLQDDYVKFIRWGHWRIEKTGAGILAFITNHGYLDNPTFRGMREKLIKTFSNIYILDLHGNLNKKETAPDGSKDENVFDIQQGVAIGIFVKSPDQSGPAKIFHAERWGQREGKYDWLSTNDIDSTTWEPVKVKSPFFYFVNKENTRSALYELWPSLNEVMAKHVTGIVTARDDFVLDFEEESLKTRIKEFLDPKLSDSHIKSKFGLKENYAWRVSTSRKELRKDFKNVLDLGKKICRFYYRPFDIRKIFFHPSVVWRTRGKLMAQMNNDNLGFIVTKQTKDRWAVLATDTIIGHKSCAGYDINYLFPLYTYPDEQIVMDEIEVWRPGKNGRRPNLSKIFVDIICKNIRASFTSDGRGDGQETFGPEDIFYYIYALFNSELFKKDFDHFLKSSFPRIPIVNDKKLFFKLCSDGKKLTDLHLMKFHSGNAQITFPETGSDLIEHVKYQQNENRVYINKKQYFEGIPPNIWNTFIGGFKVCERWLKDRIGHSLSVGVEEYHKIVSCIIQSKEISERIDHLLEAIGKWEAFKVQTSSKDEVQAELKKPTPQSRFDKTLQARLAIASHIIKDLEFDRHLGRVKFAKIFYLIDAKLNLSLNTKYYREAAGPLDGRALYNSKFGIEQMGDSLNYFNTKKGAGQRVQYLPGKNIKESLEKGGQLLGKKGSEVNRIIELCGRLDTDQCEIVATLFACWNDLLIEEKKANDQDIIKEFLHNWHHKKLRFPKRRLLKALSWMKKHDLIPSGHGKHTSIKQGLGDDAF